jgi:hypothetical protein
MPSSLRRLRTAFLADGKATTLIALLALAAAAAGYAWRLSAFLINDDEGSYLYAAWRISLGELPYRDFLTPQLPGFLMPAGWLMGLVGPRVEPLRIMAAAAILLAAVFTWKTARRLFGPAVAAGAAGLFLLQPMTFLFGRIFRSEAFMLLWCAVGVYAFVRAYPSLDRDAEEPAESLAAGSGRPAWLIASGLAFGLAILCKLFGVLPLAGCLLWLLVDGRQRRRPWKRLLGECLLLGLAATAVVGVVMAAFASVSPHLEEAVLEHHLMQHSAQTRWGSFVKSLWFYYDFVNVDQGGLLLAAALATGLAAWRARDRRLLLFGCQVATMLGFLLLTRDLFVRHVMVLVPAMTTLGCAWALGLRREALGLSSDSAVGQTARLFPVLAALVCVLPWLSRDVSEGGRVEVATAKLADVIRLSTRPDDLVFGDFSELNFYSRRPTTYAAASMSAGAAKSGQISWARVQQELAGRKPALMVEVDLATDPGHLAHMPDYADYIAWREAEYAPLGRFHRDFQAYTLYAPKDHPVPVKGNFARGPKLLGAEPMLATVAAGDTVEVATAWQGPAEPDAEYVATVRLVDLAGQEWAQSDTSLFADDPDDDRKSFAWEPSELVGQRIPLTVPADLPPGRYRVELGMYIRDAEAVKLLDAAGNPYDGRALAGEITVGAGNVKGDLSTIPDTVWMETGWRKSILGGKDFATCVSRQDGCVETLRYLGSSDLPNHPVRAGEAFPLDLWWQVDGALPAGFGILVDLGHITDSGPAVYAEDRGPAQSLASPGSNSLVGLASTTWIFRQHVLVRVAPDAPVGSHDLILRLVDSEGAFVFHVPLVDGSKLLPKPGAIQVTAASDPDLTRNSEADPAVAGWLKLLPQDTGSTTGISSAGTNLLLKNARVSDGTVQTGATLGVVVDWTSFGPTPIPYWETVQLLDAAGKPVAQQDGPAGGWDHLSDRWGVGEPVIGRHDLAVPADLPPGSYTLAAAIYNPQSGWRLPVRGPGAMGDMLRLGEVRVER